MQTETNQVKHFGMELQRSQPMEWNEFMTACIVDEWALSMCICECKWKRRKYRKSHASKREETKTTTLSLYYIYKYYYPVKKVGASIANRSMDPLWVNVDLIRKI